MSRKRAAKSGYESARARQQAELRKAIGQRAGTDQAEPAAARARPEQASAPAPAGQARVYLDVAAVRIQHWLARTPDLKGWRGASAALSVATAKQTWQARLPDGMEWNDDAGDLDGVVSLRTVAGLAREGAEQRARHASVDVLARLREELPGIALQASSGWAGGYAEAYEHYAIAGPHAVWPPAPNEAVLAKPCDSCRTDPATAETVDAPDDSDRQWQVCADCAVRYRAAGHSRARSTALTPRAQQRLHRRLADTGVAVARFPKDFTELAESGRRDRDDAATQLALIYADGNRVGAFLHAAAEHSRTHGTPDKGDIVTAIDTACVNAVAAAAATVTDAGVVRVIAHVSGGDDVLVSVPAPDGWPFAGRLVDAFGSALAAVTGDWPPPLRARMPCMSAGLVFHHRSAPFPDMVRAARTTLARAKRVDRGSRAAVAFLDITADGGQPPRLLTPDGSELTPQRLSITADELARQAPLLAAAAALPASQRATLLSLLRIAAHEDVSPPTTSGRSEPAAAALARRVRDSGAEVLYRIVLDTAQADPAKAGAELAASPHARARLRRALDMARWWPPTTAVAIPSAGGGTATGIPGVRTADPTVGQARRRQP